jgi:hypothetical protein
MRVHGLPGTDRSFAGLPYKTIRRNIPELGKFNPFTKRTYPGAPTNAILANIAAWELVKDITGIAPSVLTEKRILFNLKTMEMIYG